jgi:hypothetical protein
MHGLGEGGGERSRLGMYETGACRIFRLRATTPVDIPHVF